MAEKPATPMGCMVDSVAPATMSGAIPDCTIWNASPIAWVPVAQAVETVLLGPPMPNRHCTV